MSLYDAWTKAWSHFLALRDPAGAARYVRGREAFLSYAAGAPGGPRAGWRADNRTADAILSRDARRLTARVRDLVRNSAHVSGALRRITANVVYTGIKPQAQTGNDALNRAVEQAWNDWAADRRVNAWIKQQLAVRHLWQDGEFLARLMIDRDMLRSGLVPLRVQLLEADHLDDSVDGVLDGGVRALRGIEYNGWGDPQAYHILDVHPGSLTGWGRAMPGNTRRIPAQYVVHPFLPERISQSRGVSWLASVATVLHDLAEYQDAERLAARLVAAFGFFVTTDNPDLVAGLGGRLPNGSEAGSGNASVPKELGPAQVMTLPPGTEIKADGFKRPAETYEPFVRGSLRDAAAGVGMSYEAFSTDYSSATYSSARSASLEERRGYQVQQRFLVEQFLQPVWDAWSRLLYLSGLVPGLPGPVLQVKWQVPGWPWVDPSKDAEAAKLKLALRLASRTEVAAERGANFEDILNEIVRERQLAESLGVELNDEVDNAQSQKDEAPQA